MVSLLLRYPISPCNGYLLNAFSCQKTILLPSKAVAILKSSTATLSKKGKFPCASLDKVVPNAIIVAKKKKNCGR